jgi:4-amino-4-deoxy-L-arabinose transferase-like glycosyltransferase
MGLLRILLVAFNAAIITYLVYRLVQIYRSASPYKVTILIAGIVLLLLPIMVLIGFIKPTVIYVLIYPIAISAFIYLIKSEG